MTTKRPIASPPLPETRPTTLSEAEPISWGGVSLPNMTPATIQYPLNHTIPSISILQACIALGGKVRPCVSQAQAYENFLNELGISLTTPSTIFNQTTTKLPPIPVSSITPVTSTEPSDILGETSTLSSIIQMLLQKHPHAQIVPNGSKLTSYLSTKRPISQTISTSISTTPPTSTTSSISTRQTTSTTPTTTTTSTPPTSMPTLPPKTTVSNSQYTTENFPSSSISTVIDLVLKKHPHAQIVDTSTHGSNFQPRPKDPITKIPTLKPVWRPILVRPTSEPPPVKKPTMKSNILEMLKKKYPHAEIIPNRPNRYRWRKNKLKYNHESKI